MVRTWGALLLLLSVVGAAAGGCGKQVNVVFVNQTPYDMPLELQPPGGQRDFIGQLGPRGAVKTKIAVPEEPAAGPFQWWAGARYKGEFTVTAETDKHLRIDLLPAGPSQPYAWKGKIKTKRP